MKQVTIKGKTYTLPIYLPDATRGVTKSLDSQDLNTAGIKGVVVNTYHLQTSPGIKVLKKFGGIKKFMNFDGLVVSDSGGWQVFSLIHRSKTGGKITDEGVEFVIGGGKKEIFTPEDSIKIQFEIGSDIVICLDDFTPPDADFEHADETVSRTVLWAKRSKKEYERQLKKRKLTEKTRPYLLSVIQGGYFYDLRKRCVEELVKLDFDAYGYGGYVISAEGKLDLEISKFIAELIPDNKLKFALGFGRPNDISSLFKLGWDVFDCTLPTRDARHMRLYAFSKHPEKIKLEKETDYYSYVYINKSVHELDSGPIDNFCDCAVCKNYSKAYLRHLFKIGDISAFRLASIHNLRFYAKLLELLSRLN